MPNYRRWNIEGGTFFLTAVTHERRPLFRDASHRAFLRVAIKEVQSRRPFDIVAMVLMPDHFHALWALPADDKDFSNRMRALKYAFTRAYLTAGGDEGAFTLSRLRHRNRGVWQKRFHEHFIRDEADLARHLDYIHYNPVKHGYVDSPRKWRWSSFQRYVRLGAYPLDWCDATRAEQVEIQPGFE